MQKWICSVCGRVFLVDKNDKDSLQLKEATEHIMMHALSEYEKRQGGYHNAIENLIIERLKNSNEGVEKESLLKFLSDWSAKLN